MMERLRHLVISSTRKEFKKSQERDDNAVEMDCDGDNSIGGLLADSPLLVGKRRRSSSSYTTLGNKEIALDHNMSSERDDKPTEPLKEFTLFPHLPLELRVYPLKWMSVAELQKAALVCRDWNWSVSNSPSLWRGQFYNIQTFNPPPVRVCHGALVHKDTLIVYGGHVPSEHGDFITNVRNDLWEYNISSHEWKKICNFEPLTETMPILWNDKMYVFGGFINSWRTSTIIEYDCNTKKFSKVAADDSLAPPKGRSAYSAVLYKNIMYIYGGWDGHESMNDIHGFNLETKQWIKVADDVPADQSCAPAVRSHSAWVYKGAMYVWGGYGNGQHPTDLYKYDFEANKWSKVETKGTPPCGRSRMRTMVYGDRVFILGGWDRKTLLGDLWELNLESLVWKELRHTGLPKGIAQYSLGLYKDVMLVFGGCAEGESTNQLYGFKVFS